MESEMIWLDGEVMPACEALITPSVPGLMVGMGVFETLLWHDHGLMGLSRHLKRLNHGLNRLGLPALELDLFRNALLAVYTSSRPTRKRLRFTVFGGVAGSVHQMATCTEPTAWPDVESVVVSKWKQNEQSPLAGIKSTSYAANILANREAVAAGFGEALLLNTRNEVCEGTGSNLFIVTSKGELITPPLSSGCLPGVTREIVLEAVSGALERMVKLGDLESATEVFLTSSTRGVQAVGRLGDRQIPTVNGPWTQAAREGLMRLQKAERVD